MFCISGTKLSGIHLQLQEESESPKGFSSIVVFCIVKHIFIKIHPFVTPHRITLHGLFAPLCMFATIVPSYVNHPLPCNVLMKVSLIMYLLLFIIFQKITNEIA